jgi:hypothetical protein
MHDAKLLLADFCSWLECIEHTNVPVSQNNECIEYKVELGNSIQNHILRDYIMKYSNLGTMNASSIRWSAAASKLERGRPCCNLLDALAHSNLATWCPSWGKSPWLATTTTPCSSLPCHCQPLALLLVATPPPWLYPFLHAVALLPWQACHSLPPQLFLLLLSCSLHTLIASLV